MSEIHMTHFRSAASPGPQPVPRDRAARGADRDGPQRGHPATSSRSSIVERLGGPRLRIAIAGGPAVTKPCNCPAWPRQDSSLPGRSLAFPRSDS